MRIFIFLSLIPLICNGQLPDTSKYSLDNLFKIKGGLTARTEKLISSVATQYHGEAQQMELILLYKSTFDYKIIDKELLKNLIDSLCTFGMTENVKTTAVQARESIEHRLLGKKICDFELKDKTGEMIRLSSLNKKYVVIELWATWCGYCVSDMRNVPMLREKNTNVEFYSISLDKTTDKMKQFLEKTKYDWPIVYGGYEDTNKDLWAYLHIVAVPKYYIIDKDLIVIGVADKLDENYIASLK